MPVPTIYSGRPVARWVFFTLLAGVCLVFGSLASMADPPAVVFAALALALFSVAFVRPDLALYLLVFSMLLSPEFTVGSLEGRATLGRGISLRLDDFLLLILGFGWFARTAVYKDLGLFLRTPLNRPIAAYLVVTMLATALGVAAGRVHASAGFFYVLKYFEYFVAFFMAANLVTDMGQAKRLLFCMLLTAFLIAAWGILQIPGGGRISTPFEGGAGEPNTLGGYLLFTGLLTAGIAAYAPDLRKKAACL
ncbi:MAG: hypothetical protein JRI97_07415, partial [Deltaproteobacteria bacterium]|nr:hypothetical protein [Deltaproteobacteria bacterium]